MINSIKIAKCASYPKSVQVMWPLLACNYIFGFNGTGKSTIARLIKDQNHSDFDYSSVEWEDAHPIDVLLYDRNFIKENYDDTDDLKGVFTLGAGAKDAKLKIAEKKEQETKLIGQIGQLNETLDRLRTERDQQKESAETTCWKTVKPRESRLRGAFEGHLTGRNVFFAELLKHRGSEADSKELSYLQEQARVVFDASSEPLLLLPSLDASALLGYEQESILETRIVASGHVPIARLVDKMRNSDWLRQGRSFTESSEGKCPYCQQVLPDDLEEQLNALFDEEFDRQRSKYESLVSKYVRAAEDLREACRETLSAENPHLDAAAFENRVSALEVTLTGNLTALEKKRVELSGIAELGSSKDNIEEMCSLIAAANNKTNDYNETVADLTNQKKLLTQQIWRHVVEVELKPILEGYSTGKKEKEKEIRTTELSMKNAVTEQLEIQGNIKSLQEQVTDVHRVLNDINRLLKSFGFTGFSLKPTDDGKGYRIIRPDESSARESLSEGERSFVTLLYFYHLVGGSHDSDGATTNRVVVFDDPVSSMDSEVLFIVSTLIREICDGVEDPGSHIKQVFCFTHNVYFHKEVSYARRKKKRDAYWLVRKPDNVTEVRGFGSENPVKSSYQLLWDEIGVAEPSPATVQNNIRRILEHYFQFNGATSIKKLADKFADDDPDKRIALAMVSWLHAGSHTIADDVNCSLVDQDTVAKYLNVFRKVFKVEGHINHYLMMCSPEMRAEYELEETERAVVTP